MSVQPQTYQPGQEDAAQSAPQKQTPKSKRSGKSDTAFRTISEVADELDVQQHVLRFWETKFSQIKPLKRGGGRRYYRPEDMELLKSIHHLLYTEGYTIKGVQKLLKEQGKNSIVQNNKPAAKAAVAAAAAQSKPVQAAGISRENRSMLESMLVDLKELRNLFAGE